jgi:beta-N-acetylhexosaminidase
MTLGPLMVDLAGHSLTAEDRDVLAHPLVGSVILFTRNYTDPPQLARLVADIQAVRSPALLVAVDHEGGRVQRFREGFSVLPAARRIGHEYDLSARQGRDLAREIGWLLAAELRAHGIDFSFAPCVDLDYGVSEVIGDRAFHARADVVADLAIAAMHGMRDAGMAAVAKHFPGHGAVVADSHLAVPVDRRALVDFDAELVPYRRLVANGLSAIMTGHILVPAVDDVPASLSRPWIRGVIREQLDFRGVVFTDDLSMAGATAYGDVLARCERALAAGADVLCLCNDRPGVLGVLDGLRHAPDPTTFVRLARLRGRGRTDRTTLHASNAWQRSQALLARCAAPPVLDLEAGHA